MISPQRRAAAAFVAASSSATLSSWTGWIVPRIMPSPSSSSSSGGDDVDTTAAKSTNAATLKHRIDPGLLCLERGLESHPYAPKQQEQQQELRKEEGRRQSNNNTTTEQNTQLKQTKMDGNFTVDDNSQSTVLDVYIFPSNDETTAATNQSATTATDFTAGGPPLHVKMDRNSQELVNKTLHRMKLSIQKQISKVLSPKGKKQKKGQQQQQQQAIANDTIISKGSDDDDAKYTTWNIQGLTNQQVWTEAITTPLEINIALENVTLCLKVDSNPPTVMAVQSFEDFETRVFCHVPLVVEVQSLFTSHVMIDWYVDGKLVCTDCNAFTPLEDHINKTVAILITPQRRGHSGRGYEQAYQFQHPVEPLPENTITKIRQGDIWTNPHRRHQQQSSSSEAITTTTTDSSSSPLRVLTYNILADQNAYARTGSGKEISYYPYVDLSTLDKKRRMPMVLHEILSYQADIICLQEVDDSIWKRLLRPALEQAGYQGYFSSKVAKGIKEGCALLWSLHRFESIPIEGMKHYGVSDLITQDITAISSSSKWKSAADIATVLMEKKPQLRTIIEDKLGHVVQMVSLPLIKSSSPPTDDETTVPDRILVANTHLFYHPYGAHIRLMQMHAICQQFERFRNEAHAAYPMILCGDMNSSLRRAAGYLLIHRQVQSDHSQIREHFNTFEWKERNTAAPTTTTDEEVSNAASAAPVRVEHTEKDKEESEKDWQDFPTVTLPDHFPSFLTGYPIEPEFTHYLDKFVGSLDHIFISQSCEDNPYGFTSLRSAPMPTVEDATEMVAMPSEKFPSDHVSLVADLKFSSKNNRGS